MKLLLLFLASSIVFCEEPYPKYIPTDDFIDCRVTKLKSCSNEDIGADRGTRLNNYGRISDYSHRNIYHDVFTYKDGVLYIERPIRVVESWRTASDTEFLSTTDGLAYTCRHSACIVERTK